MTASPRLLFCLAASAGISFISIQTSWAGSEEEAVEVLLKQAASQLSSPTACAPLLAQIIEKTKKLKAAKPNDLSIWAARGFAALHLNNEFFGREAFLKMKELGAERAADDFVAPVFKHLQTGVEKADEARKKMAQADAESSARMHELYIKATASEDSGERAKLCQELLSITRELKNFMPDDSSQFWSIHGYAALQTIQKDDAVEAARILLRTGAVDSDEMAEQIYMGIQDKKWLDSAESDAEPAKSMVASSASEGKDGASYEDKGMRGALDMIEDAKLRVDKAPKERYTTKMKDLMRAALDKARNISKIDVIAFGVGESDPSVKDKERLLLTLNQSEVRKIVEDPKAVILVLGFADRTGDDEFNMKLSMTRAEKVITMLKKQCNVENALHPIAIGPSEVISEANLEQNRAAEVWIVTPGL